MSREVLIWPVQTKSRRYRSRGHPATKRMRPPTLIAKLIYVVALGLLPSIEAFEPVSRCQASWNKDRAGESLSQLRYTDDDNHGGCAGGSERGASDSLLPSACGEDSLSPRHVRPRMLSLPETDDYWKEWHYSFSRNGLTDFLPQFSDHLSCLMVGDGTGTASTSSRPGRLPWQQEPRASITNLPLSGAGVGKGGDPPISAKDNGDDELLGQVLARTAASLTGVDQGYDCIIDRGLMNAVVSSLPSTVGWHSRDGPAALVEMHVLMREASRAIQEHGIYVAVTDCLVPPHAKEYLLAMGEAVGMEWQFDLDGLSSDGINVSVARKYFTGELPSFGKLARTDGVESDGPDHGASELPLLKP